MTGRPPQRFPGCGMGPTRARRGSRLTDGDELQVVP
jgi:hypothetical protein